MSGGCKLTANYSILSQRPPAQLMQLRALTRVVGIDRRAVQFLGGARLIVLAIVELRQRAGIHPAGFKAHQRGRQGLG